MNVGEIRHRIWAEQKGLCISCGIFVTELQAHLHERVFRGHGGAISLENSEILCAECHLDRETFGHGKRKPEFGRKS